MSYKIEWIFEQPSRNEKLCFGRQEPVYHICRGVMRLNTAVPRSASAAGIYPTNDINETLTEESPREWVDSWFGNNVDGPILNWIRDSHRMLLTSQHMAYDPNTLDLNIFVQISGTVIDEGTYITEYNNAAILDKLTK